MRVGFVGVVSRMVFSLVLGAGAAVAQPVPPPGDDGPGPMGVMGWPARFLELTEEQRALVEQALEQQRPEMKALHEQMRRNRDQLREALESPAPDAQSVGALVIEGERLRKRVLALCDETDAAIEGFLTPEQKRKREMLEAARAVSGPTPGRGPFGAGPREGMGRGPR